MTRRERLGKIVLGCDEALDGFPRRGYPLWGNQIMPDTEVDPTCLVETAPTRSSSSHSSAKDDQSTAWTSAYVKSTSGLRQRSV